MSIAAGEKREQRCKDPHIMAQEGRVDNGCLRKTIEEMNQP